MNERLIRTLYGVGYVGVGKFKAMLDSKQKTKEYEAWTSMLARCYNSDTQKRQPTYSGCTVSDEWLNFQNFAGWYTAQKGYNESWQLDKDLTNKGNKCYSSANCCLVPSEINKLTIDSKSARGEYPQGVSIDKRYGTFRSRVNKYGVNKHLGMFKCVEDAFSAYKVEKEMYVKEVADKYKDALPAIVYENLYKYEVQITD